MLNNPLGEKLRKKRLSRKVGVDFVESSIGVRKRYIIAIEESRYEKLPGRVYVDNFIKKYASFLGLNVDDCLDEVDKEYKIFNSISNNSFSENMSGRFFVFKKRKNLLSSKLFFANNILKNIVVVILFLLCFTYIGVEAVSVFSPPNIKVYSPNDNMILNTQSVFVEGEVEVPAKVYINDKEIMIGKTGVFAEEITLRSGVNIIKVSASKRHGRPSILHRKVLVIEK